MRVPSASHIVPSLFRCLRVPRVCIPVVFSGTAVQFSPDHSYLPSSHFSAKGSNSFQFIRGISVSCPATIYASNCIGSEHGAKVGCSTESVSVAESKMSRAERMKRLVKEYGATVIVFHICISLFTLGVSYTVVSR